jgi:hypothetical protein
MTCQEAEFYEDGNSEMVAVFTPRPLIVNVRAVWDETMLCQGVSRFQETNQIFNHPLDVDVTSVRAAFDGHQANSSLQKSC